jgi:glycoprotein 3-alpha-L-fucosyltransferase
LGVALQDLLRQAKFTLAFENSATEDYVTEKLFQPLIAGSVPVVYGPPNLEELEPGPNSLINAYKYTCV